MRSTNRKRALLVSGAVILLCMTIIVGMTFALFTDGETITNHLKAGELDITLKRTELTTAYLTERGFLDTVTDRNPKDFTNNDTENVFAAEGALVVPGSWYSAKMEITNNNDKSSTNKAYSNVAFGYWISIDYKSSADVDLASQMTVFVYDGNGQEIYKSKLKDLSVGDEGDYIDIVPAGKSSTFTVKVMFDENLDDHVTSNKAQGDEIEFDLVVHAVQYTGEDPKTNS